MIITIVAFIIIFSILILVHEIGHFTMARRAGVKVEEFGIGLPPQAKKLFKDKKGTVYSLNWIPFGGFVRMYGEDSFDPEVLKAKGSFASKTILQRTSIVVAGVAMNFLLAWVLITIGFSVGMRPFLANQDDVTKAAAQGIVETQSVIYIHNILPGSALTDTGIESGDAITQVDGQPVSESKDFSSMLAPGKTIMLTVIKEDAEKPETFQATPNSEGKLGIEISSGDIITDIKNIRYPVYLAPVMAAKEVSRLSVLTVKMLGEVITTLVAKFTVPEGVAGPVGIFKMTGYFAKEGFMALVHFTALISISLGVINIMPFPALDGGRFLFIIFEAVTRRKPNAKLEKVIHGAGFAFLMLLILVITWNDIMNLF